jgi:hypothetical protein
MGSTYMVATGWRCTTWYMRARVHAYAVADPFLLPITARFIDILLSLSPSLFPSLARFLFLSLYLPFLYVLRLVCFSLCFIFPSSLTFASAIFLSYLSTCLFLLA